MRLYGWTYAPVHGPGLLFGTICMPDNASIDTVKRAVIECIKENRQAQIDLDIIDTRNNKNPLEIQHVDVIKIDDPSFAYIGYDD